MIGVANPTSSRRLIVDADLDTLATALYVRVDDLLKSEPGRSPCRPRVGIAPKISDAELVTLAVMQALLGHASESRWLRYARAHLHALFPYLPQQPGYNKRLRALAATMNWLIGVLARDTSVWTDDVWVVDSTPVECGRSLDTVRRSQLAEVAGYGYSKSHSRWFWGMRLHLACAPDGTPRAAALVAADRPERETALRLLPQALQGGETIICDKGYAGAEFHAAVAELGATLLRPPRRDEPQQGPHLAPIRQRIESVFFTCKDLLTLERHGARTPRNLFARIATRLLALAACISLNHKLGRPSRALADYTA